MPLHDKHVVVAGGSSGLGLGVAAAALAAGARVTITARSPERLARAREALAADDRVVAVATDIAREEEVARLFRETGPFDHLVVTAVTATYQRVAELQLEAARRALDVKLLGPLLLVKHGAPLALQGGSITFTAGINAHRPAPGGAVLAAANGALEALGRALAVELAPLRVNVVAPGWVDTPVWDSFAGERKGEMQRAMAARLPTGRIGTTADLAHAFVFLMENEFATGSVLHVDGGHRLA